MITLDGSLLRNLKKELKLIDNKAEEKEGGHPMQTPHTRFAWYRYGSKSIGIMLLH